MDICDYHWFRPKHVLAYLLEHLSRTLVKEYAAELGFARGFVVAPIGEQDIDHPVAIDVGELYGIGVLGRLADSGLGCIFPQTDNGSVVDIGRGWRLFRPRR